MYFANSCAVRRFLVPAYTDRFQPPCGDPAVLLPAGTGATPRFSLSSLNSLPCRAPAMSHGPSTIIATSPSWNALRPFSWPSLLSVTAALESTRSFIRAKAFAPAPSSTVTFFAVGSTRSPPSP
jgi:hypothetical protein